MHLFKTFQFKNVDTLFFAWFCFLFVFFFFYAEESISFISSGLMALEEKRINFFLQVDFMSWSLTREKMKDISLHLSKQPT